MWFVPGTQRSSLADRRQAQASVAAPARHSLELTHCCVQAGGVAKRLASGGLANAPARLRRTNGRSVAAAPTGPSLFDQPGAFQPRTGPRLANRQPVGQMDGVKLLYVPGMVQTFGTPPRGEATASSSCATDDGASEAGTAGSAVPTFSSVSMVFVKP